MVRLQMCPYCMALQSNFRKQNFECSFLDPQNPPFTLRSASMLKQQKDHLMRMKPGSKAFVAQAQQYGIGITKDKQSMAPCAFVRCPGGDKALDRASTDLMHNGLLGQVEKSTSLLVFTIVRIKKWGTFDQIIQHHQCFEWAASRRGDTPPEFK